MKRKGILALLLALALFIQGIPPFGIMLQAEDSDFFDEYSNNVEIDISDNISPPEAAESLTLQAGAVEEGNMLPLSFKLVADRQYLSENSKPAENSDENEPAENNNIDLENIAFSAVLEGPFSIGDEAAYGEIFYDDIAMGTYSLTTPSDGIIYYEALLNETFYATRPDVLVSNIKLYVEDGNIGKTFDITKDGDSIVFALPKETENNENSTPIFPEDSKIMGTTLNFMQPLSLTGSNNIDIIESGSPKKSDMDGGKFDGAPDAFSTITVTVGNIGADNKLPFNMYAEFNPEFLIWFMEKYETAVNILANNPPNLAVEFYLP
ncbi:hypothetical protein LJB89_03720, partial [Tyzzerella sp. OttesenSCG-928-J15]|nr:hypothetical protein [Tyzzerella sp. OttesenSCG-928-J15]